jgi:hypothetical protein
LQPIEIFSLEIIISFEKPKKNAPVGFGFKPASHEKWL